MNPSTQEEEGFSARSHGLQEIRSREGAATKSWLRLRAAGVAAAVAVLFILGTGAAQFAQAQVGSVLHSFTGSDGNVPVGGLIEDSSGNLYGTTNNGGSSTYCGSVGCGTVFEMVYDSSTNSYTEKVLYSFSGTDGENPEAGLIMDSSGNLYGTTMIGGSSGDGTVFELSPPSTSGGNWTEKVLHSFTGSDGSLPRAGLIMDSVGNLYGTTYIGGSNNNNGTVFELSPPATSGGNWTEKMLYNFTGTDGGGPMAGLIIDSSGNLYGTTDSGGSMNYGTVFELSPPATSGGNWTEKVLYSFTGTDGDYPVAGLIMDSAGNLYGTTEEGGSTYSSPSSPGDGIVFELSPPATSGGNWTEKVLYNFTGTDGNQPSAGLYMDSAGNLYGTTVNGGSSGQGTVFELSPPATSGGNWTEKFLYSFTGTNGVEPTAGLIMDSAGNLYGTTTYGGSTYTSSPPGDGTVFGIAPITLSATSLSFGSVAVDSTSTPQKVTITNIGGGNFSYSAALINGKYLADFAIATNGCSAAVAPNATCSVSVTFTPSTATAETSSVDLSQGGMTQVVNLTGTGVYPTASVSASSLTFSSQDVGSTSSSQTVTVSNTSNVTLNVTSVGITGDFAIASNTCNTVAAGKTCTVGVTFSPTASGARTGTLSITDNASNSPQTVALSGTGEDFTLGMASGSSSSATVSAGGSANYTLTLTPESGFNQAVNLACSGAPAHATCTVSPASVTLNGSSNSSVSVKVSTTAASMVAPGPGNFGPPPSGSLPLAAWLAIIGLLALIVLSKFSPEGGRVRRAAPWATLALLAALCAGCGGGSSGMSGGSSSSTPAGTYTMTVTAKSGNLTHTTQVTLTVQ